MTNVGGMGCLSTIDSVSPGPKEEVKPINADNGTKYSELTEFGALCCLPTMDSVSPGPMVQLPRRATHAFGDLPSQQYLSMYASTGVFPVTNHQGAMNSRDSSRTWLMDKHHHYNHNQAAMIPSTEAMWGHDSFDRTNIKMCHPMPSIFIQEMFRRASMPIMTGSVLSQTGTHHQDRQNELSAITNASRRASISNMMTFPGRALMPEGIRCSGEHPSPIKRRYSAPVCRSSSELDTSKRIYNIQELDVNDSNILDMWWSSRVQETDEF